MMRLRGWLLTAVVTATAWSQAPNGQRQAMPAEEQQELQQAVQEGSSSAVDLIRALESHLEKYPDSLRRPELERALVKAAIENKDERRIRLYGERVLSREPDDMSTLERVIRSLLLTRDLENMKKVLQFAKHYEELVRGVAGKPVAGGAELAKRKDDIDRALGHALVAQAIAAGNLGDAAASAELARKSFTVAPSAEAAVELARRLAQLGRTTEAIRVYADAFAMTDSGGSEADRASIRSRLGELYRTAKGSEAGLGDVILEAYDRNAVAAEDRRVALRKLDPNIGLVNPMEFTLTGVGGDNLAMASLLGKAVVMDFWATWCGPCRAQHPLYEEVKKRFADRKDVVFLAINTDEDREAVKPFLVERGWSQQVYYEDGLSRILRVNSIPTTVVIGRSGLIVSRMNGFDPPRFADMLTERIKDALKP